MALSYILPLGMEVKSDRLAFKLYFADLLPGVLVFLQCAES